MYTSVEEKLRNWIELKISQNRPVNAEDLEKAAIRIAKKENIKGFHASAGWIASFQDRYGFSLRTPTKITTKTVFGEKELVRIYWLMSIFNVNIQLVTCCITGRGKAVSKRNY